jgi:hypothetical protein
MTDSHENRYHGSSWFKESFPYKDGIRGMTEGVKALRKHRNLGKRNKSLEFTNPKLSNGLGG